MKIQKILVIGGGTMGNGIAHVSAQSGYTTYLSDVKQEFLDRAMKTIGTNLDRQVKKGTISEEDKAKTLSNLFPKIGLDKKFVEECDLIIEAIPEDEALKKNLYDELKQMVRDDTILASNTSSISITKLGAMTKNPSHFIGMHFMNPVPMMKLVEVIRGLATSDECYSIIEETAKAMGKVPVLVQDYPGFVANRILMPMINEAIYALYEGVATKEAIDEVMKLGMSHPMGPLTLADFIGLDVCLAILEVMHNELGDPKYRPCPLLRKMVAAGYLGRKTSKGFYQY
ncbi:MAG: 3-hydroxybutyryl-CoA dehydrogenase [bacterium]|nr:3-hydroxybutyryl-CoA dehydrogenase [bacterium]